MNQLWHHFEKRRYYRVYLIRDLWGQKCIVRSWGSLDTHSGGFKIMNLEESSFKEAIERINRMRLKRGYVLVKG